MKKIAIIAAALATAAATPAVAGTVITSVQITNIDGIAGQGYLQIAELQLFANATNVAAQTAGGVASASSVYANGPAFAANANDGSLAGTYPSIYHGAAADGSDVFTVTLAAATNINRISIFGRTDACCTFRDVYSYTFLNGATVVGGGTLDARATSFATAAVPEPAVWAMMLGGFGMIGFGLRHRGKQAVRVTYA